MVNIRYNHIKSCSNDRIKGSNSSDTHYGKRNAEHEQEKM